MNLNETITKITLDDDEIRCLIKAGRIMTQIGISAGVMEAKIKAKINNLGIELIKKFEGFVAKPYKDPIGIISIGYGCTEWPGGLKVTMSDGEISESTATDLLIFHAYKKEMILDEFFKAKRIKLNSNQYSSLLSFAYNLSEKPIIESGRSMNMALLNRDLNEVGSAFLRYVKAGGKILNGLILRREAEKELFFKPLR